MAIPTKPSVVPRWARTAAGAAASNVTTPTSGQQDTGWTAGQQPPSGIKNFLEQLNGDWLAQLAIALPTTNGASGGYLQGFEPGLFPPNDGGGIQWSAPSYRFLSDVAFVRDTSNPIANLASANRPGSQSASTNSSMGFDVFLLAPSRIAFVLDLLCNNSFGDHLDFYVDGSLNGTWSTTGNTVPSSGRYVTTVLREGYHYFDWRFVRGAAISVANEKSRIDLVAVMPESSWSDRYIKLQIDEDFIVAGLIANGLWSSGNSGNAGTVAPGTIAAGGSLAVTSAAVAIGDWEVLNLNTGLVIFPGVSPAQYAPFLDVGVYLPSVTQMFVEVGFWDGNTNFQNYAAWVYDSNVGTDWRFKTVLANVATTNPTGIVALASGTTKLSLSAVAGLTNGNGWLGAINGSALPNTGGANHCGSTQNLPSSLVTFPYVRVGSRIAAAAKAAQVDFIRMMAYRAALSYQTIA